MGKKIPAKKHHGVKDPLQQQEKRMAKIKMKINEAPTDVDHQEAPKKIKMLFSGKPRAKNSHLSPRAEKIDKKSQKLTKVLSQFLPQRPLKPIPKFKRNPGESDRDFLWRTELATRNFLNKAKFEEKYQVDVLTDQVTGEVEVKKQDWSFLNDGKIEQKPRTKREKKQAKQKIITAEKLKAKKQKFKEIKMNKKNKKMNKDDFHHLKQDKVEFGDVVQAPPSLTAKPRRSTSAPDLPGKRDLLLKSLVPRDAPSSLSGKRKDLSALDRERLEEERQRAVFLYREIQKGKHKNNDFTTAPTD